MKKEVTIRIQYSDDLEMHDIEVVDTFGVSQEDLDHIADRWMDQDTEALLLSLVAQFEYNIDKD